MSYEEKMMTTPGFSANTPPITDIDNLSEALSVNLSIEPPQVSTQQTGVSTQQTGFSYGPVAILWDIENCPVPSDVRPEDVAGNIRMALRVHPVIKGAVTMFSAYGDFNAFPRRLREGCQRTGVKLVDVPNGRKDAADKAILVDMFLFALDNRPPSSILLISGDVDFAPALHILGQRGYTIILVIPAGVGVSSALSNAGRFVWDWPSVARGEGFVPPRASVSRGYDFAGYLMNCNVGSNFDNQNDEEAIVYKGVSQSDHSSPANLSQTYSSNVSRDFSSFSEYSYCNPTVYSCNPTAGNYFASSRTQSLPFSLNQGPGDQNNTHDKTYWVQPGDLQGLKGQLVRLVEMFGGSLPLVRVPAEYIKLAGRPLYVAEYGAHKLVNLINKMSDTFYLAGKGPKKLLCISNSTDKHIKKCPSTPVILKRDTKGKGHVENMDNGICTNMGSSSDDFSDEEKVANSDECLESFRMEMQELLVCYSRPIPLGSFVSLYEQRYKKLIDYQSFGVDGLEQLLEKARDVVELHEDQGTKRKFLVSTCGG